MLRLQILEIQNSILCYKGGRKAIFIECKKKITQGEIDFPPVQHTIFLPISVEKAAFVFAFACVRN